MRRLANDRDDIFLIRLVGDRYEICLHHILDELVRIGSE